jgi:hypothetical protein
MGGMGKPPMDGAYPINIGGRHPSLPDVHAPVRQHEPLTPRQPVRQNSPVDQRGAHH